MMTICSVMWEGRFEIIDGDVLYISPHVAEHGLIVRWLFVKLFQFITGNPDWEVFQELAFAQGEWGTTGTSNWVNGALELAIMIVSKTKVAESRVIRPDWKRLPVTVVPALVIEVVSLSDRYKEIMDKIAAYLRLGVTMIWLIDPHQRTVNNYEPGKSAPTVIRGDQPLVAADVMPGLSLSLVELFDAQ